MKAPLKWLRQYTEIEEANAFASRMVMAGFEVEELIDPAAEISNVIVGRILKIHRHPNADKLIICTVDTGAERPLQIVTGAANVFEGALVPVSVIGSRLPGGIVIKRSKLRGVESEGMLCSGEELKINEDYYIGAGVDGILIFHEEYAPGSDVLEILGIKDPVIDFKVTANRAADCMSITGLAREASVILGKPFHMPQTGFAEVEGSISDYLKVEVQDSGLCPRYMARVVRSVKIAPSPLWMRQSLAAAGVRPINNIVDITNYVMLELGQPMHAFDYRNIRGGEIIVRRAGEGETLQTLDGKVRELNGKMLVITDMMGPIGLAGIMGGEHSGIYDDTSMVVFESANFQWSSIRLTSRALGMRTESSARYEKDLPQYLAEAALNRAMALIEQLGAGEVVKGAIDCKDAAILPRTIIVQTDRVCGLLGQQIDSCIIIDILQRLGFGVQAEGNTLTLEVPLWRQDVESYADVAEEVQRLYGYHTIPSVPPPGEALLGRRTKRQEDMLKLRGLLSGMGLNEAMSYSFIAPSALDKLGLDAGSPLRDGIRLLNPIGEDYSLMRTTLAPSMLRSIAANNNRKIATVRLFEINRTFLANHASKPRNEDGSYSLSAPCFEDEYICIGITDATMDFYDLKGLLETLFQRFGIVNAEFKAGAGCYYHPGRSAAAFAGGEKLAELGELHPDVTAAFEVEQRVLMAEINVEKLLALGLRDCAIQPLPKFPSISRDLAVVVDALCPVGDVLAVIRSSGGKLLESVALFDIYRGIQVGEGKKSVAFSLVFRSADHTLVDDEATICFEFIVSALNLSFGAEIRS